MTFWEFAVVAVVAISAVMGLRILSAGGSKQAYKDALRIKDGMLEDLKGEVRKWKGRSATSAAPPYGADDIESIVKKLPSWSRPFVGPIVEWSKTDEGKETIEALIKKYAKIPAGSEPEGV